MNADADIITRCPQCSIAFRVTVSVLRVANGTVRCGSCLRVFNAKKHTEHVQAGRASGKEANDNQYDKGVLDPLMGAESQANNNGDDPADGGKKTLAFTAKPDASQKIVDIEVIDSLRMATVKEDAYSQSEAKESREGVNPLGSDILLDHQASRHGNTSYDSLAGLQYAQPRRWPWVVGTSVMAVLLLLQISWLRFETLVAQQPYRSYYGYVCEFIKCTLPVLSDVDQIQTTHLIVSSHPNNVNALNIDAVIINKASFSQPFPALIMTFLDLDGNVVANRGFQPSDYLRGELTGATVMPANQPVQLTLSIVDPGEKAINYQMRITGTQDRQVSKR